MSNVEKEPGPTEPASPVSPTQPEKRKREYKDFGEEDHKPTRTFYAVYFPTRR
jgi:H+-transporting ATPase